IMKCITLGNGAKVEELMLQLLGEPNSKVLLDAEEMEELQLGHTWKEKEKGKIVYLIDDEEVENFE
ncbi:hypothetical protein KI387_029668, partial [Taxus chinensis]